MKTCLPLLLTCLLVSLLSGPCETRGASPNPPGLLSYQGFLTDANGNPLGQPNPVNKEIEFRIYDAATGGNLKWGEKQTVTIDGGHFSVMLGEGTTLGGVAKVGDAFLGTDASDRYIGITVKGLASGDPEISPRLRLLPTPYAFLAQRARSIVDDSGNALLESTVGGLSLKADQFLGIGTKSPHFPLSLASGLGSTKLALWENAAGTESLGLGVQAGQFRLHLNAATSRFSFLDSPEGAEVFTVTGDGRVGVGISNPAFPLSLAGGLGNTKLALWQNASGSESLGLGVQVSQFRLHLNGPISRFSFLDAPNGNELVTFEGNGNAGIGVRPQAGNKLEVAGKVKADTFEGNGIIPVGGIIMWSGSTVPAGWALCNGQNGTPDLRDRFILGTATLAPGQATSVKTAGGASSVTLTADQLPPHQHSVTVGTVGYESSYNGQREVVRAPDPNSSAKPNNGNQSFATSSTGSGQPVSIMPPFFRLAFLMRTQ